MPFLGRPRGRSVDSSPRRVAVRLLQAAEPNGAPAVLEAAHSALEPGAVAALSFASSMSMKAGIGGTAPQAVERQIEAARAALRP